MTPLIVGWQSQNIGKIGAKVTDFLMEKLGCRELGEIKPAGFFALGGATFREDLIQVPVMDSGMVAGLLSRADIVRYLHLSRELRFPGKPPVHR